MWHGTIGRSTFSVSNEKGIISSSPACSSRTLKLTDDFKMRGGVPVFNLPVVKPSLCRFCVRPKAALSPIRPHGASYSPIKIRPPKKVPVVKTTERTGITLPRSVTIPITFCRFPFLCRLNFSVPS